MSDSSWPHGLQPTRLLHPWDFPGKSTGVGCHCLILIAMTEEYISICIHFQGPPLGQEIWELTHGEVWILWTRILIHLCKVGPSLNLLIWPLDSGVLLWYRREKKKICAPSFCVLTEIPSNRREINRGKKSRVLITCMCPVDKRCYQTKLGSAHLKHSKASLLTPGCSEGRYSIYCKAQSKKNG